MVRYLGPEGGAVSGVLLGEKMKIDRAAGPWGTGWRALVGYIEFSGSSWVNIMGVKHDI